MQVSREHIGKRVVIHYLSCIKSNCIYAFAVLVDFDDQTFTVKNEAGKTRTYNINDCEIVTVEPSIKYYYAITLHDYDYVGDHSYYLTADDAFNMLVAVEKSERRAEVFVTTNKLEFFS